MIGIEANTIERERGYTIANFGEESKTSPNIDIGESKLNTRFKVSRKLDEKIYLSWDNINYSTLVKGITI